MCAHIVKQVLEIEGEADQMAAKAEAEAKRLLAESAEQIDSLRKKSAVETESAAAKMQAEFERSWEDEEKALRREFAANRDYVQKAGAEHLSSAVVWVVNRIMGRR